MAYLEDILKKLGWDDGFQMPVANAENQALEKELAQLTLQKTKTKNALDITTGRLVNLKEHFKYVIQESEQTQKLITAHKQQYDNEKNQYNSLKGEKSKTEHDTTEVNKRITFLEERKTIQKTELQKAVIKVDKLKQETGWDIEALKAWEEALKKRDDDNELIRKFSKEDERKFNELEAKRQFLQTEYYSLTLVVNRIVGELHNSEMIIERTGKAIQQQISAREALIKQWKDAVKMLQQRDVDIEAVQSRILEAQKVLESQLERLEEENAMLNNEKKNNHDIEMEIEKLNVVNSRMRQELSELEQTVLTLNSEYHTLKRRIASSANNLERLRMKNKNVDREIAEKKRMCIKYKEDVERLENKISEMKGSAFSSGERIKKIQKMIENAEKYCTMLIADTEKINSNLYRTDQLLKEQQTIGKNLGIQINNSYCMCNKLRKHIEHEKKGLEKLKEVVYDMQFRIDEFEQRLCKLEGANKHEDHTEEKEEKIRELEKTLSDHAEVQHTLQIQVDRLQDNLRKLSNFIAADKENLETLENKLENHLLEYEIGRKQIIAAKKSTQEKQVEENIMRLRINHIEADMEKETQKIFNLQKLRLALDQVMKERNLEIDIKKSVVLTKKRTLEEEKGRMKSDISQRNVKLEQMQKKYHIELMSLGKDEAGQPLSVTHFKIKNAQEKFTLQQQGDELDHKIKVAEKEIVAMENTLKVVNLTNVAFKNNLSPLKEDALEVQEMNALERLQKEWILKCRQAKQELEKHQAVVDDLTNILNDLLATKARMKEITHELEEENIFIEKQERSKEEKLNRTETQVRKIMKKLKPNDMKLYDKDFEIKNLKDANSTVWKKLNVMTNEYPDMAPNITKYFTEYNINLQSATSLSSVSYLTSSSDISSVSSSRSLHMEIKPITVKKVDISFNK